MRSAISAIALLLLALTAGCAQGPALQPAWVGPEPGGFEQSGSGVQGVYPSLARDFWIVSSRNCRPGCNGCLEYFHVTESRVCRRTEAEYLAAIDPARPILFTAHGGYYNSGHVVIEGREIQEWLDTHPGVKPQLVCFSWPSDGPFPAELPVDVAFIAGKGPLHAPYLAQTISRLPPGMRVSLLGHSYGARVIAATLHLLGGGTIPETPHGGGQGGAPQHLRAAYIAPAMDHHWLDPGERYSAGVPVCERILILRNSADWLLPIYPLRTPFGHRALGHKGLGRCDWIRLGPYQERIEEIDGAPLLGLTHNLKPYYEQPWLGAKLATFLSYESN